MPQSEIWQYPIRSENALLPTEFDISMPGDAYVLDAQIDNKSGKPVLWAVVKPGEPERLRNFHLLATGQPFNPAPHWKYIATFQMGPLVWHVFESTYWR